MSQSFHPLSTQALATDTVVFRYGQGFPVSVNMDATAMDVMTDLLRVKVYTIAPETPIDNALQKMIHAEVRLLIVTDYADSVLGVITATDIMGERPIAISSAERVPHSAIRVEQIMTARNEIDALRMKDVENASVGDIVATLRGAGRQHAIVLDQDERGKAILRGIFSTTQIAKLLGVALEADGKAQSFAELERALQA